MCYNVCIKPNGLSDTKLSSLVCFNRFKSELPTDLLARAVLLREAVLIRDNVFSLPSFNLNIDELNYLIE